MAKKYTPMLNNECFFTGAEYGLECHHIFGGASRRLSEKYGLKVWLHHSAHNEPPNGVHHNEDRMQELHEYGQRKFIEMYPDLDFCTVFQRPNYLGGKDVKTKWGIWNTI